VFNPARFTGIYSPIYNFETWPRFARLQNSITLNTGFFDAANTEIISAIKHDKPILVENGGRFSDEQLDNYLGDFEMIATVYKQDLLSEDDLCRSSSYYASNAADNSEIQSTSKTLASLGHLFPGFSQVVKIMRRSKK